MIRLTRLHCAASALLLAASLAAPSVHAKPPPAKTAQKATATPAGKGEGKKPEKAEKKPEKGDKKAEKKGDKGKKASGAKKPVAAGGKPKAAVADATPVELSLNVQRASLDNGLRVVLNVDHTSPTVAVAVTYDVGSRGEQHGRSGFAHLFEHMMFQGSRNVPKGEHFKLVSAHGGVLNGTTSTDRTNYFEVVPANELGLALWLESDRMKTLDVSQATFENQRKVVQEEYRMRVSNAPYVPSQIRLEELVYQGYWPYEHSTIGSMADLDGAKLDWVTEFHDHHYAPNNAVLTLAGDFEPDAAMQLVHQYFDGAKKAEVAKYDEPPLPEQTSQRTAVVKDDNVLTPGILYGWAVPAYRTPDHYAIEIAAAILGDGESSRLHQLLVRDKATVQDVEVGTDDRRGPDLLTISAQLADGAKVGDVEKEIEAEVKALGQRGPSDAEMAKAHRRVQSALVLGLQSNMARAMKLGELETFFGDARVLNGELPKYLAVTKEDVQRVTAQYLGPTKRTIVETYPATPPAPPPKAEMQEKKAAAPPAPAPAKGEKHEKKAAAPAVKPKKK